MNFIFIFIGILEIQFLRVHERDPEIEKGPESFKTTGLYNFLSKLIIVLL